MRPMAKDTTGAPQPDSPMLANALLGESQKLPKVAIIIPHFNYSIFVDSAIDSIISQTYTNIDFVVIDDQSDESHLNELKSILASRNLLDKLAINERNLGQTLSFFAGFDRLDADFYCLLDPDDALDSGFVEEMVSVHLNPYRFVAMVCCDQMLCASNRQLTGTYRSRKMETSHLDSGPEYHFTYFGWRDHQWPWTSVSSMMFRRDAIKLLRPHSKLPVSGCADSYLGQGCRFMGGTIFYQKPLVFRGVHEKNGYLGGAVVSSSQDTKKDGFADVTQKLSVHALHNIIRNGGTKIFNRKHFRDIIRREFSPGAFRELKRSEPIFDKIVSQRDRVTMAFRLAFRRKAVRIRQRHVHFEPAD